MIQLADRSVYIRAHEQGALIWFLRRHLEGERGKPAWYTLRRVLEELEKMQGLAPSEASRLLKED